jgi:hypothetical protein
VFQSSTVLLPSINILVRPVSSQDNAIKCHFPSATSILKGVVSLATDDFRINSLFFIVPIHDNEFILKSSVAKDVADGKWHFIALSWELTGRTRIFIDAIAIKIVDKMSFGTDAVPET